MRFVLFLCASLFLARCASHSGDDLQPKTASNVNLKRYQGTWYELARLPMYFQRNCAQSEARYTLLPDGDMSVFNRCLTPEWKWQEAKGTATPQVPGKTDKLWVEFNNWFTSLLPGVAKGDYWVIQIAPDYSVSLVGSPDRKYLWILSRTPTLPAWEREHLLAKARQQGYDTSRLIWRASDQQIVKMH